MDKDPKDLQPENELSNNEIVESSFENENKTEVSAHTEIVEAEKPIDYKREIFEWILCIAIAIVIAMALKEYVFTMVKVEGSSMLPTLHDEDRLGVWRLGYKPKFGDIIILHPRRDPKTAYVKRVIGLPGQTVTINFSPDKVLYKGKVLEANTVYVDDKPLNEPYIYQKTAKSLSMKSPADSITVEENTVFVMGDNRNNSSDSRDVGVGLVEYKSIMGKAVFRWWPFNSFGTIDKSKSK